MSNAAKTRRKSLVGIMFGASTVTVLTVAAGPCAAAPVGWVFAEDGRTPAPASAVRIERGGKVVTTPTPPRLEPCDTVASMAPGSVLVVKLLNGARFKLTDSAPNQSIACIDPKPFGEKFKNLVMSFAPPERGRRDIPPIAATRGDGELTVLGLGPHDPMLVAGRRSLFVAWTGGSPPYFVTLAKHGDTSLIVVIKGEHRRSVQLPLMPLSAGTYVLQVGDSAGTHVTEEKLEVVPPSAMPVRPPGKVEGGLDGVESGLLDALFLETYGAGEWELEALQLIASLPKSDRRVNAWLSRLGVGERP